ncbi:MAG: DNRLRE domain-containing protein, partial [Acidimicrobiia bacterium]|nr:DNRLRE domain-containing protein [Acidimicrobiia bacterium]
TAASAGGATAPAKLSPTYPKPQADPQSASAHVPPPAAPATPTGSPKDSEGWTTFSHWTRNANGSVTSQIFDGPAFRHKNGGGWEGVDASVHPSGNPAQPFAAEGAVRPVRFGQSASNIMQLALDGGPVTLSSTSLNVGAAQANGNGVTYQNVATDTDLRYRVSPGGVKEELVLRSANAPHTFTFHLADPGHQLGNATPTDGGGVQFSNLLEGDTAVTLTPPVAYSAANPAAHDPSSAHLLVVPATDGFDVTVNVDEAWLQNKTFPVVLDPTMGFNDANNAITDGVASYAMSTCGGCNTLNTTYQWLATGSYTDTNGTDMEPVRSFVKFDLSQIPAGSVVSASNFGAYLEDCTGTSYAGDVLQGTYHCDSHSYTVELHQMNGAWGPSSTYSSLAPLINGTVLASKTFGSFAAPVEYNPTQYSWDLTAETQAWVNGTVANNGFAMKTAAEPAAVNDPNYNIGGPAFGSSDNGWRFHPTLTVTYTPPPLGPQSVSASAGNGAATVTWAPPSDNGGPAPTGYTVSTYSSGGTLLGQTSACATCASATIGSLNNGSTYSFSVAATSAGGTGPATPSNVVSVGSQPSVSVQPTSDVTNTSGVFTRGQTLTYKVTVAHPGPNTLTGISLTDALPGGVLPAGTSFTTTYNPAGIAGITQSCPKTAPPGQMTCNWDGIKVSITGLQAMAPNDTYTLTYQAVALGSDRGCSQVLSTPSVGTGANNSQVTVPVTVCDTGLGLEHWWSYASRTLGPQSEAKVNVANGNLVLQATDTTPVQAHGHLAYVLRRTYNSQDSTVVSFPGSIGSGWSMNVGQADDLIGDGVGANGLYVPPAQAFANPFAVTLIDRDGTRHVFQARSLGTNPTDPTKWVDVSGLQALTNPGALGALIPNALSVLSGHRLCVDQSYVAPAGVHLALWRYLDVTVGTGTTCAPLAGTTPSVLGFGAERPDRLRYEFSWNGRLLDMVDGNGVDLRYAYENLPAAGVDVGRLTNVYEAHSCTTGPTAGSTCRAFRFNYSQSPVAGQPLCTNDSAGASTVCVTDPAGRPTSYVLDSSSRLIKVDNPDGQNVTYAYGSCGGNANALCSVSDPRGHASSFTYAAPLVGLARVSSLTDRRSTQTTVSYERPDYVHVDTAGANRYALDTPSERQRFTAIDATGRVGEVDEGDTADNYRHETTYTWDTSGAGACRQPDSVVDNNLCRVVRHSLSNFSPDEDTRYVYGAEGQLLSTDQVTAPADAKTTNGYHAQYVDADGGVTP